MSRKWCARRVDKWDFCAHLKRHCCDAVRRFDVLRHAVRGVRAAYRDRFCRCIVDNLVLVGGDLWTTVFAINTPIVLEMSGRVLHKHL